MSIYEFKNYKVFVRTWIKSQPKQGRGLKQRMAEQLRTSSTMMSHVFESDKDLSFEMASELADFMGLTEAEADYFILLVQLAKAGNNSLRRRIEKKIVAEQKRVADLTQRVKADVELPDIVKATFYSNWIYAGVRNLTSCPTFNDVDTIAAHLSLSRATIQKVVDFLLQNQLCVIEKNRLTIGPQQTHIGSHSALVNKHHQNWRLHGMTKMFDGGDRNVFFTGPMSISKETADQIRMKIPKFIEEISKLVRPSPSETVRCLNLDWFEF